MYKRTSAAMQRYHKVYAIDAQPTAQRVQDDLLPSTDRMLLAECEAERGRLLLEKTCAEQELIVAKRQGDARQIAALGLRIQGFCNRIAEVKRREKSVRHDTEFDALTQAVREITDEETWSRIVARKIELRTAMLTGGQR